MARRDLHGFGPWLETVTHDHDDLWCRASRGSGSGNVRNGSSAKTVRTDVGEVRINVPRDRVGTFSPTVVPKHTRRLTGFDDAVLSLYAKGMTTTPPVRSYGRWICLVHDRSAIVETQHSQSRRCLDTVSRLHGQRPATTVGRA